MTSAELIARYPYMFEGRNIGLTFYKGWVSIIANACEKVDSLLGDKKHGFRFVQIKEKFGSARLYYEFGDSEGVSDEQYAGVRDAISEAEGLTNTSCQVCGANVPDDASGDGWIRTLCAEHSLEKLGRDGLRVALHD